MTAPWRIQGRGGASTLIASLHRPAVLFMQIAGLHPASDGLHLRARYVFAANAFRPAITGLTGGATDDPLAVEFDVTGGLHLNWPGSLYLVGGDPTVAYDVRATLFDKCVAFHPTWHPLTVRLPYEGNEYTIPDYHSRLRATAPTPYTLAGNDGILDHQPIPVCGGGVITFPSTDKTIITDWWG